MQPRSGPEPTLLILMQSRDGDSFDLRDKGFSLAIETIKPRHAPNPERAILILKQDSSMEWSGSVLEASDAILSRATAVKTTQSMIP